jgi:phage tail-like protein
MSNYPLQAYHFSVDWGGSNTGFTEVSGLSIFFEAIQYRDGNLKDDISLKIPGLTKFSNIVLKRGIIKGDFDMYKWISTKNMGSIERRTIIIKLLNELHEPAVTWKVLNSFPVRYSGPILNAKSGEVAMEELELAHEGIEIIQ